MSDETDQTVPGLSDGRPPAAGPTTVPSPEGWGDEGRSPSGGTAASVIPTPFGLVRMWEQQGNTYLAEVSSDGAILGAPLPLAGAGSSAACAAAVLHALAPSSLALSVTWISGSNAAAGGAVLLKTWELSRGAEGLRLAAANDNPVAVAHGATEASLDVLAGDTLLLTWVDAATGAVSAQLRACDASEPPTTVALGHAAVEPGTTQRRVHVVELTPFEIAVYWIVTGGHGLEGIRLERDAAPTEQAAASAWVRSELPPVAFRAGIAGPVEIGLDHGKQPIARYQVVDNDGRTTAVTQVLFAAQQPGASEGAAAPPDRMDYATFGDMGFLWASQDMLQLNAAALQVPAPGAPVAGPLSTRAEEPLVIDLAAHGAAAGVKLVAVDGTPLAEDGPTRVASGWMQLRADGRLTFTPDVDAAGQLRMHLTGLSETGGAWHHALDVQVESLYGPGAVALRNPVGMIPARAVIAHNAQVAEIGIEGDAPTHGAVSLSGVDADKFIVIGNGLFLRAGTRLEPGRKGLDVSVGFRDGLAGAAVAASLSIAVVDDPRSFLSLAFVGRAQAAEVREGTVVAEIGSIEAWGGDRVALALLNNAGGRFALSGNTLVVASPYVFEGDASSAHEVVVRAALPNGVAVDHKITLHPEDIAGRLPPAAPRTDHAGGTEPHAGAQLPQRAPDAAPADPSQDKSVEPGPAAADVAADGKTETVAPQDEAAQEASALPASLPLETLGVLAAKGSSGTPDLGPSAGVDRGRPEVGQEKLVARQRDDHDDRQDSGRRADDDRGGDNSGPGGGDEGWWRSKDIADAIRDALRSEARGGNEGRNSGSSGDAPAELGDTLLFKPGFGRETIEHVRLNGGETHDVLDLSLYGTTFEALRAAGAFAQVGNDVVVTLNPADPMHSDQIVLKSVDLQALDPSDFKFS